MNTSTGPHEDRRPPLGDIAPHEPGGHRRVRLVEEPVEDPLGVTPCMGGAFSSARSIASITSMNGCSSDAQGPIFSRGFGYADSSA
ncbi:hypothetical protein [Nonomuraea sp. NPDC049309]|uniref:hypothetical protein n=1 Tax=Nonomuraea sp. NPDC049309 TaxID=3364350 RepID=UPI003724B150